MNALITKENYSHIFASDYEDAYSYHVKTFLSWMEESGINNVLEAVPAYFKALNESDYKASTIRVKRQAVKNRLRVVADSITNIQERYAFDKMLESLDRNTETKAPKLNSPAISTSKIISEAEYYKLLEKTKSERTKLFMRYLWQTGCRVAELTSVELRNCKRVDALYEITIMGKGRKERMIKITATLYDMIREQFNGERYLFETGGGKPYRRSYVSYEIAKATERILGRKLSAHKFRHSFVTNTIHRTNKIAAVSKYVGHSSVATTMNMYMEESLSDSELFGEAI